MIKLLTKDVASTYIESVGMSLGAWNEIRWKPLTNRSMVAPDSAMHLTVFAHYLAGCLPYGASWKLIQFDNSTCFSMHESLILGRILFGSNNVQSFNQCRSVLLEPGFDVDEIRSVELLLSHVIFIILIFKAHAQIITSDASPGNFLSLQDGVAYLSSPEKVKDESGGIDLSICPKWIQDIDAMDD
jgi:hypothetical protein